MSRAKPMHHEFDAPQAAESITEPGCYVCHWSGHLLRVPMSPCGPRGGAMVSIVGDGKLLVTRLSADPFVPLTVARELAARALQRKPTRAAAKSPPQRRAAKRAKSSARPAARKATPRRKRTRAA